MTMQAIEDRLYELLELADQHQKAVQLAVDALTEGKKAFVSERTLVQLARDDLSKHLRNAVTDAAAIALTGAVKETTTLLREEMHTLKVSVNELRAELGRADEQVKHMLRWTGWRFVGVGLGLVLVLVVLGAGVGEGMLAWNTAAIDKKVAQREALSREIAALQKLQDQWVSAENTGEIARCGDALKPCVRIDPNTSFQDRNGHTYQLIDAANP